MQDHQRLQWILLLIMVCALAFTACTPITPQSLPATEEAPPMAPGVSTPTFDANVANAVQRAEAVAETFYSDGEFTGAALIAHDGDILWTKAWGMADRAANISNTPQTLFAIGEIGTQFTAAAMLLLEQAGKLSVQDPICTYLDDCPDVWQGITIHHLLSHTSGIPDYFDSSPTETRKLTLEGATPAQLTALFRDDPLYFEPGARRDWSHSGFVLAGLVIERASGQSYRDFVQQHIFAPLGMTQSVCGVPSEASALGYPWSGATNPVTFDLSVLYGSGNCYSTAEDLFRWNEGLYNGQLLNETQLQKMLTPYTATDAGQPSGYGIVLGKILGRNVAGNGGGVDGYGSVLDRFLDDKVTLLVVGNQQTDIFAIADQMEAAFFGTE